MAERILNHNQLRSETKKTLCYYDEMLSKELRTIGLREKIIRRKVTLQKTLQILTDHTDK